MIAFRELLDLQGRLVLVSPNLKLNIMMKYDGVSKDTLEDDLLFESRVLALRGDFHIMISKGPDHWLIECCPGPESWSLPGDYQTLDDVQMTLRNLDAQIHDSTYKNFFAVLSTGLTVRGRDQFLERLLTAAGQYKMGALRMVYDGNMVRWRVEHPDMGEAEYVMDEGMGYLPHRPG